MEDGVAILVTNEKVMLVKVSGAVGIAQLPQAEEIVCEAGHDVSGPGMLRRDGRDAQLGCRCGELRFARCRAYGGAWGRRVNVEEWCIGGEVVVAGARVRNGGVLGMLVGVLMGVRDWGWAVAESGSS